MSVRIFRALRMPFVGLWSGRYGDFVYVVRNSEQYRYRYRERAPRPPTPGQRKQTALMRAAAKAWTLMSEEGKEAHRKRAGESDRAAMQRLDEALALGAHLEREAVEAVRSAVIAKAEACQKASAPPASNSKAKAVRGRRCPRPVLW